MCIALYTIVMTSSKRKSYLDSWKKDEYRKNRQGNAFNPFWSNVPFIYPLKTSENLWLSDDFKGTLGQNGVI